MRLLKGEQLSSSDLSKMILCKSDFRDEKSLEKAQDSYRELYSREMPSDLELESFQNFKELKIVPSAYNSDLLNLYMGSHDPKVVELANTHLPCRVFNLSITPKEVIEKTHQNMLETYHKDGGAWQRDMMPRTDGLLMTTKLTEPEKTQSLESRPQGDD